MILHIVRNYDNYSGAAFQALRLVSSLKEKKVNIAVLNISSRTDVDFIDKQLNCYSVNSKAILTWNVIKLLISADVVHFHGLVTVPFFLSLLLGKKVLLKSTLLGEDDFDSLKSRFGKFPIWVIGKLLWRNNALARNIYDINSKYIDIKSIEIIPNGVDMPLQYSKKKQNTFLFVGAIVERKQPHLSVEFFNKYLANLPGACLVVIGPDDINESPDDKNYREQVFFPALNNSVGDVKFLGRLDKNCLSEFYAEAKGLLFFSKREGMPNVVLEAMANNCLPITTSISGAMYDITGNTKLEKFIIDDVKSVNFSIEEVNMLIRDGVPREIVEEKFSFDGIAKSYIKIYSEQ